MKEQYRVTLVSQKQLTEEQSKALGTHAVLNTVYKTYDNALEGAEAVLRKFKDEDMHLRAKIEKQYYI